jgi:allantoate deiminase
MRIDRDRLAAEAGALLRELAGFSEPGPGVTRLSLTAEHRAAIDYLDARMRNLGMVTRLDSAASLIGRLEGADPTAPALLIGSHLDSVREGGMFDGALGVALPLVCLEALHAQGERLPFPVEIVAFGDEEGSRFPATLGGSRAMAGSPQRGMLELEDSRGVRLDQALRDFGCTPEALGSCARRPEEVSGFLEVHIEQGPVLEAEGRPVGIVSSIASAARFALKVEGQAGHAGTVPMGIRRDALAGAAAMIVEVERCGRAIQDAVATVGRIEALPGAVNVISGEVRLTLDLRAPEEAALRKLIGEVEERIARTARERHLNHRSELTHRAEGRTMSARLGRRLARAIEAAGLEPRHLPSGAGHDAMAMADLCETAMLFVRCRAGLSHHPDESCSSADLGIAAEIVLRFLLDAGS